MSRSSNTPATPVSNPASAQGVEAPVLSRNDVCRLWQGVARERPNITVEGFTGLLLNEIDDRPPSRDAAVPASDGVEAVEQVRYHWEVIQGQCSEGDGFTERAAVDLELAITALEAALSPAPTSGSEAGWQIQFEDGSWSKALYDLSEINSLRATSIVTKRPLYALAKRAAAIRAQGE